MSKHPASPPPPPPPISASQTPRAGKAGISPWETGSESVHCPVWLLPRPLSPAVKNKLGMPRNSHKFVAGSGVCLKGTDRFVGEQERAWLDAEAKARQEPNLRELGRTWERGLKRPRTTTQRGDRRDSLEQPGAASGSPEAAAPSPGRQPRPHLFSNSQGL